MSRSQTEGFEELLSVAQAARLLAVRESTVRAWLSGRRISRIRLGRRCVRIPVSEVQRLIIEGTIPARGRTQEAHA